MIVLCTINEYSENLNNIYENIGTASLLFILFPSNQESIVWVSWLMGIQIFTYYSNLFVKGVYFKLICEAWIIKRKV